MISPCMHLTALAEILCRHPDHAKIYKERCSKLAIPMNARALPKGDSESVSRQGTLDGNVAVLPRVPPFTSAGLLDYIVELVVCEDEVCLLYWNACVIMFYYFLHRHFSWWTEGLSVASSNIAALRCLKPIYHIARLYVKRFWHEQRWSKSESKRNSRYARTEYFPIIAVHRLPLEYSWHSFIHI